MTEVDRSIDKLLVSLQERAKEFTTSPWQQTGEIIVQDGSVGRITVCYVEERPREAIGPFIEEEERLIRTIADRVAHCVL